MVRHYQIYNQCVEHECSRNHFYGWAITYEKMKQYVLENDEFKKMSDVSEKMGKMAVKLSDVIICSKYDDENVRYLFKTITY